MAPRVSTRRRLDLLRDAFLTKQIPADLRSRIIALEASVERRFSRHRGEIAGRQVDDNEIKRILRDSDDTDERRAAWEASKTIGALVADDVRELARLRNAAAHAARLPGLVRAFCGDLGDGRGDA